MQISWRFEKEMARTYKNLLRSRETVVLTRPNGVITSVNQICLSSLVKSPCYKFSGKRFVPNCNISDRFAVLASNKLGKSKCTKKTEAYFTASEISKKNIKCVRFCFFCKKMFKFDNVCSTEIFAKVLGKLLKTIDKSYLEQKKNLERQSEARLIDQYKIKCFK